jgi:hypothetical protein
MTITNLALFTRFQSRSLILKQNKKFWEELMAYFPLIQHGPHRKRHLQQFLFPAGTCLPSRCLATIRGTVKVKVTL